MGKNGDEKGGKSGSLTNDEDSMDMDGGSGKGGHGSGSDTGLDLDKSALSPDDSTHSQSSRDETISCEKPPNAAPLSLIEANPCCAEVVTSNRTNIAISKTDSQSVMSPNCEDIKISPNASHLLHSALSSVSSPVTRNTMGSPSGMTISPKGHQSPSEPLSCAPIHSVTKVRNWTPNTRQPLNTLNTIECHSNHNPINSLVNISVNSSTALTAQPIPGQHPSNGCNYYNNRCVSTTSSQLSTSSSTLSYGRRQRYSGQTTSRSSPSNPSLPPTGSFCYRTSPTDSFGTARSAQQTTCVSTQEPLATTKFFSNPNIANGGNGSLYSSQQSSQSTQSLQRSHYFNTDYNCDYSGARSEPQTYPQRQAYESPYIQESSAQQAQQYASNGGTISYANHTNYANIVSQANQISDQESYGSENNAIQTRAQPNANTYTNSGYYEVAVNSSDQNSHRIPSEYNAIALKQQPNEYSSQSQLNTAHQHQYYDIQNSGTGLATGIAVSPNIPNTFDQNFCNSNSNNSSDPTATCYNTYNNSNYYDVYNNCTSGLTNNEFNFINIANEFASPEYYQLS